MSGSAIHPIIHLGFSVAFNSSTITVAEGLAYLTHSYLCLTDINFDDFFENEPQSSESLGLASIIGQIYDDKELWNGMRTTEADGFQSKLKTLQNNSRLKSYLLKWKAIHSLSKSLSPEEKKNLFDQMCQELAETSAFAFYYTNPPSSDFFLLHGVTGCYATICAAELLEIDDAIKLLFYFCYTFLAAYVVEGSPDVISCSKNSNHPVSPVQDWDSIINAVTAKDSEKDDVVCICFLFIAIFVLKFFYFLSTW